MNRKERLEKLNIIADHALKNAENASVINNHPTVIAQWIKIYETVQYLIEDYLGEEDA